MDDELQVFLRSFGLGKLHVCFGHNKTIDVEHRGRFSAQLDRLPGQTFISVRIGQRFVHVDIL